MLLTSARASLSRMVWDKCGHSCQVIIDSSILDFPEEHLHDNSKFVIQS